MMQVQPSQSRLLVPKPRRLKHSAAVRYNSDSAASAFNHITETHRSIFMSYFIFFVISALVSIFVIGTLLVISRKQPFIYCRRCFCCRVRVHVNRVSLRWFRAESGFVWFIRPVSWRWGGGVTQQNAPQRTANLMTGARDGLIQQSFNDETKQTTESVNLLLALMIFILRTQTNRRSAVLLTLKWWRRFQLLSLFFPSMSLSLSLSLN